jgi:hypothetical protein
MLGLVGVVGEGEEGDIERQFCVEEGEMVSIEYERWRQNLRASKGETLGVLRKTVCRFGSSKDPTLVVWSRRCWPYICCRRGNGAAFARDIIPCMIVQARNIRTRKSYRPSIFTKEDEVRGKHRISIKYDHSRANLRKPS